jgi:hypothetical protein
MILSSHGIIGSSIVQIPPVFLLNDYPGAAAAYSLRKLRSAYTGSAIRVRRTDLQESDIGFTSSGALDTTALLAFTGTGALDNGFIKTWYDQSGNSRNANQTTALSQPQIVSSGSVILENGKPAIDFDAINDALRTSSFTTISQPTTHVVVCQFPTINLQDIIIDGISQRQISVFNRNTGFTNIFAGNLVEPYTNDTNQNLYFVLFNGSNSEAAKNGTNVSSLNPGTSGIDGITIGSNSSLSDWADVKMQELIIYDSNESSNRTGIETNINDFYSIY